jgi:hypothetical protein
METTEVSLLFVMTIAVLSACSIRRGAWTMWETQLERLPARV